MLSFRLIPIKPYSFISTCYRFLLLNTIKHVCLMINPLILLPFFYSHPLFHLPFRGEYRSRTDDPLLAKQVL